MAGRAIENVIISGVFTKCWAEPRLKVSSVNHEPLAHFELSPSFKNSGLLKGGALETQWITAAVGKDLETDLETDGKQTVIAASAAAEPRHHAAGALPRSAFPAVPLRLPVCQDGRHSL